MLIIINRIESEHDIYENTYSFFQSPFDGRSRFSNNVNIEIDLLSNFDGDLVQVGAINLGFH